MFLLDALAVNCFSVCYCSLFLFLRLSGTPIRCRCRPPLTSGRRDARRCWAHRGHDRPPSRAEPPCLHTTTKHNTTTTTQARNQPRQPSATRSRPLFRLHPLRSSQQSAVSSRHSKSTHSSASHRPLARSSRVHPAPPSSPPFTPAVWIVVDRHLQSSPPSPWASSTRRRESTSSRRRQISYDHTHTHARTHTLDSAAMHGAAAANNMHVS